MSRAPLHLFEGFGVELEYMIVDAETLSVKPIADELLKAVAGKIVDNADMPGGITWSNELALHVIELKATRPLSRLEGSAAEFQKNVRHVNEVLRNFNARLMPTAMHPWMRPLEEMRIWPHEYNAVYETFNRIFNCRGHGWANLQSVHLNLPFSGDNEFGRLHAAIRILLPILPALSASSPVVEQRLTGFLDTRLEHYRNNSARIPSVAGQIVPEAVFTRRQYEEQIFEPMYADVAPHDPEGILRDEFLNARGAIARFSRSAIEIRVLDVQECPQADVAICAFIVETLKALLDESLCSLVELQSYPTDRLRDLFLACLRDGERTKIADPRYAALMGLKSAQECTAGAIWQALFRRLGDDWKCEFREPLGVILERGPLARRILTALGEAPSAKRIAGVYGELCACLEEGRQFG